MASPRSLLSPMTMMTNRDSSIFVNWLGVWMWTGYVEGSMMGFGVDLGSRLWHSTHQNGLLQGRHWPILRVAGQVAGKLVDYGCFIRVDIFDNVSRGTILILHLREIDIGWKSGWKSGKGRLASSIYNGSGMSEWTKQDDCLHCSTVRIPLFIDVPDHLPASWLNNRTSHLAF